MSEFSKITINRKYNPKHQVRNIKINYINIWKFFGKTIFFTLIILIIIQNTISISYRNSIFRPDENIESIKTAIIFGSASDNHEKMSIILEDRLITGIELYKNGVIQDIFISASSEYEINAMKNFLIENKIPDFIITSDSESKRTYDTCWRSKKIYKINQAILISQEFHLSRALYICNSLGIKSIGVIADKNIYSDMRMLQIREWFSTIKSILDVNFLRPYEYKIIE